MSLRCPSCGSRNTGVVQRPVESSSGCGSFLIGVVVVVAGIIWVGSKIFSSSPSSASDQVVASATEVSASAVDQTPIAASSSVAADTSVPTEVAASDVGSDVASSPASTTVAASTDASAPATSPAGLPRTFQTSFDCSKASADDETAICSDAGLAAMDRQLDELYHSTLQTISNPKALEQSESDWLATRQMCNKDLDCLRHAYGARIGQFLGSLGSKPLLASDAATVQQ